MSLNLIKGMKEVRRPMPTWFKNQLQNAYYKKDRHQIKLLNQCWFFYNDRYC